MKSEYSLISDRCCHALSLVSNVHYFLRFILLTLPITVLSAPASEPSGPQPYIELNSFSYSEATAISAIAGDWDKKLYAGELAFSVNRIEVGVSWKQFRVGLIQRYETYDQFSADTAELLYRIERKKLKAGDQYAVQLSSNTLEAGGLRIGYVQPLGDFNIGLALSYLAGRDFIDGAGLTGNAQVISDKDYDINFDVNYLYSKDKLFGRDAPSPEGQGYAIDFSADWKANENWFFKLDVMDLRAEIKWQGALRTVAAADSNTKEFDKDGYVIFNPVASGIETTQAYTQTITRKIFFKMKYSSVAGYPIIFEYDDYKLKRFASLGTSYVVGEQAKFSVFYNFTASALKFGYQNKWLNIELVSDEIKLSEARTFGLQLSAVYRY